jgi:hypothetical protein
MPCAYRASRVHTLGLSFGAVTAKLAWSAMLTGHDHPAAIATGWHPLAGLLFALVSIREFSGLKGVHRMHTLGPVS